jgi:hypothetical protein
VGLLAEARVAEARQTRRHGHERTHERLPLSNKHKQGHRRNRRRASVSNLQADSRAFPLRLLRNKDRFAPISRRAAVF